MVGISVSRGIRGESTDGWYGHVMVLWRREAEKRRSFLFHSFLIESHQFVILI